MQRLSDWAAAGAIGLLAGLGAALADRRTTPPQAAPAAPAPVDTVKAVDPWRLSPGGWRQVLARTWSDFNKDQITAVAAGVTFFGLLSLFPAISAFVSLFGLVADVGAAQRQIQGLQGLLPGGAISVIGDQMTRLAAAGHTRLGAAFAVSLLLSLWSSNAGVKALMSGLNVAYERRETRKFLQLNAVSLAFTIGTTLIAVVAIAAVVAVPAAFGAQSLGGVALLRWPALLIVLIAGLSVLYRYGPSRQPGSWRWITPGGLVAAVGWLVMSLLFSWYAANFGSYNKTYGSLGAVVGFMTWIWLSVIVILFGAELNSELANQTTQ